ncbi:zinc dependent phospholipase C family protein [Comamonadaceae bacterium PP-2]
MPGAYAHIAIANDAQKKAHTVGLREQTLLALGLHLKYVELGAVSPDYPYLTLGSGQAKWADAMHYTNNATLLRAGVAEVFKLPEESQHKATAWLLGFAAHMTTDMTIHPVVELLVGPYAQNKGEHRRCEMHQDAFIFPKILDVGDTGLSQHLKSGIATCTDPADEEALDPDICAVWRTMLNAAYPNEDGAPNFHAWHGGFTGILAAMANTNQFVPFARHVATGLNLAYPEKISEPFVKQLQTPEGLMDYESIYARARSNVLAVWKGLDDALVQGRSDALDQLENWDLDTGRSVQTGQYVFWGRA